jgi:hypothetical protein
MSAARDAAAAILLGAIIGGPALIVTIWKG